MTTIQLLEQLGADPAFRVNAIMRQKILDELQDPPQINFIGLVTPEDEEDEKEQEDEKDDDKESDKSQKDGNKFN